MASVPCEANMKKLQNLLPGLLLIALLSALALFSANFRALGDFGIGPLTVAIVTGAVLGNLLSTRFHDQYHAGIRFSQTRLLRAGVALYGLNLSMQQVVEVGSHGLIIDLFIVVSTLALGYFLGTRLFKMDKNTALLTAAGNAICGAAAIVATAPLLRMTEEKTADATAAAVSTVVLFGSIAMLLYPAIYALFGLNPSAFGLYVGSTVHEVAQVVAIGNIVGGDVAHSAVIVKMIRVLMLVPFLLSLSVFFRKTGHDRKITIPWFAIAFLAFAVLNSLAIIPAAIADALRYLGLILLTAAMGALGMDIRLKYFRHNGLKAVGLGVCLFIHLSVIGGLINYLYS